MEYNQALTNSQCTEKEKQIERAKLAQELEKQREEFRRDLPQIMKDFEYILYCEARDSKTKKT
jgi:hypothetical protein